MSSTNARRVALTVGDTLGHFYPALAVMEAYRRRAPEVDVTLFGPARFAALAARHACRYCEIVGSPLARVNIARRAAAAGRTVVGIFGARRALRALGTELAIGFGGYASGAVLLAGRSLGLRTAIHEANVRPGLANRLLAKVTDRVYLGRAAAGRWPHAGRIRVTGWPVRPELCALAGVPRAPRRPDRPARILVCSASRGAGFLCREVPSLVAGVRAMGVPVEVHHQSGDGPASLLADAYSRAGVAARVSPFIDDMAAAYQWADFAIARAGAGTIAELAVAGLPSLLIPLADAAEDHQTHNAAAAAAEGAAEWAPERTWDRSVLASIVAHILTDAGSWTAMSAGARRLAAPSAADAVVDDCESLMREVR